MQRQIIRYLLTYLFVVVVFAIERAVFVGFYSKAINLAGTADLFRILAHGVPMDLAVAGYVAILPGLMLVVESALNARRKWLKLVETGYFITISLVLSLIFVVDIILYDYWGFRLDMTPVFYFTSSPSDALASISVWVAVGGFSVVLLWAASLFAGFYFIFLNPQFVRRERRRWLTPTVLFVATAALFIPIRGGFTVSTMNLSKAYFSQNQGYNHAAVNPAFSLLYSASHQTDFGSQFRYLTDQRRAQVMATIAPTDDSSDVPAILSTSRPDVIVVILESFSNHILPVTGGEPIAMCLDSIARQGLTFTRFYANSFRTDRGLTSIISGYPAQPTTSILKYVEKAETLPSFPKSMKAAGYDSAYYYGGDADFTNMSAYLVSCGFEKIISDKDFALSQKMSKWGANDGDLVDRFLADYLAEKTTKPRLRIVQTSSSHEPFNVPYNRFSDPRANAFAYADAAVGRLVDAIRQKGNWANTLFVFVPDHYGCYPELTDKAARHEIPLIFAGGALTRTGVDDTYASQIDLAATLLCQLGIDHSEFAFSKNVLDPHSPHFAYISEPGIFGIISEENTYIYNYEAESAIVDTGATSFNAERAKAFVQTLYDDLDKR